MTTLKSIKAEQLKKIVVERFPQNPKKRIIFFFSYLLCPFERDEK